MRRSRTLLVLVSLVPALALVVACGSAPPNDFTQDANDTSAGDPTDPATGAPAPAAKAAAAAPASPAGASAVACPYTGPPLDVSGFAACRDGGRCIPKAMIPPANLAQVQLQLAACPGGFCAPEKMVKSQNMGLPTACKSLGDIEGRCTSTVILQIDAQKDQLPRDACDANERCAPCFDPLSGMETGACHQVSCDAPKAPFTPLPTCCSTGGKPLGRCLPTASLPAAAASGLEQRECPSAADSCIPAEEMTPTFVHSKCSASSLLGAYQGVCISNCAKKDFFTNLGTGQGNCGADSFCAPCTNPLTGAPTGAPNCGP